MKRISPCNKCGSKDVSLTVKEVDAFYFDYPIYRVNAKCRKCGYGGTVVETESKIDAEQYLPPDPDS